LSKLFFRFKPVFCGVFRFFGQFPRHLGNLPSLIIFSRDINQS
jgi:hypothetical protein